MPKAFSASRKRGRPKMKQHNTDTGTPELIYKRAHCETSEAIDLCLERSIITPVQHGCGLHLRWLYTLRYGAPGISALTLTPLYASTAIKQDDPDWRQAREKEYREAAELLKSYHTYEAVMKVCIYNERPQFLRREIIQAAFHHSHIAHSCDRHITALRDGLELLAKHWKRGRTTQPMLL